MATMAVAKHIVEPEDHKRDHDFNKALHGNSAELKAGLVSALGKQKAGQDAALDQYFKHFDNKNAHDETEDDRMSRRQEYATLTRQYYNLATDLYEYGWGSSFHFCRFAPGEAFTRALARHEHYLAYMMGLRAGMKVLDVGCGVGGPAMEICRFTDVSIVGLNNNDYQIQRAQRYVKNAGLQDKITFVKGDFMQMSFEDNTFDAVYAIEATVHAPTLQGIYSEICRVLKPGGVFGVYEWLMTDKYDAMNPEHVEIRLGIEKGNGISNMEPISVAIDAIESSGFTLERAEDLAEREDRLPWYWPLTGDLRYLTSITDLFFILPLTRLGRTAMHSLFSVLETLRLAPLGFKKTADHLAIGGDSLVRGAREKLFTPMYLMIARKPQP